MLKNMVHGKFSFLLRSTLIGFLLGIRRVWLFSTRASILSGMVGLSLSRQARGSYVKFLEGRDSPPNWDLNGGQPRGARVVVRSARDPLKFPDDPTILKIVSDALCVGSMGENCYVIKNVYGHERAVPYGASLETWHLMAQELMEMALAKLQEDLGAASGLLG